MKNCGMFKKFKDRILNLNKLIKKYRQEKSRYLYRLVEITYSTENDVRLNVVVSGVKATLLTFTPEEILYDDEILSQFSPYDVRALMYLSFQKYLQEERYCLEIIGQSLQFGRTIFHLKNSTTLEIRSYPAEELYKNYDNLHLLDKKDIINVISTAVQEQAFIDMKSME